MGKTTRNILLVLLAIGAIVFLYFYFTVIRITHHMEVEQGEIITIDVSEYNDEDVSMESDNESVVSVYKVGELDANSTGEATVTLYVNDKKKAVYKIEVVSDSQITRPTRISLDKTKDEVYVGSSTKLTANLLPVNVMDKKVTWISSDQAIATVDEEGNVLGVSVGTTTILARTSNGKMATCTINVNEVFVEEITLDKTEAEIRANETLQLTATIKPDNATVKDITWKSSDPSVATVDEKGFVTAKNPGDVIITVTSSNEKEATLKLKVKPIIFKITFNPNGGTVSQKEKEVEIDTTYGVLPIPQRAGYDFIGWFTNQSSNFDSAYYAKTYSDIAKLSQDDMKDHWLKTGMSEGRTCSATNINKNSKVELTADQTLYAIWEKKYVITEDARFNKYSAVVTYNSETLKYKMLSVGGKDFVIIWVKDAYKQVIAAMPKYGNRYSAEYILGTLNLGGKGVVATNASFFSWGNGRPISSISYSRGTAYINPSGGNYAVVGMNSSGKFNFYQTTGLQSLKAKLDQEGVHNSFSQMTPATLYWGEKASPSQSGDSTSRTLVGQVDANNFVVHSGNGLSTATVAYTAQSIFGVKFMFNLDGGGSSKLYYKTNSSGIKRRFGGDRAIPDMLCFIEQ